MLKEVEKSEKAIKDRVGIGMSVPERALVNQLTQQGLNESAVRKVKLVSASSRPKTRAFYVLQSHQPAKLTGCVQICFAGYGCDASEPRT